MRRRKMRTIELTPESFVVNLGVVIKGDIDALKQCMKKVTDEKSLSVIYQTVATDDLLIVHKNEVLKNGNKNIR
jgi:hypothetical protein